MKEGVPAAKVAAMRKRGQNSLRLPYRGSLYLVLSSISSWFEIEVRAGRGVKGPLRGKRKLGTHPCYFVAFYSAHFALPSFRYELTSSQRVPQQGNKS